jgi:hypothetical protein
MSSVPVAGSASFTGAPVRPDRARRIERRALAAAAAIGRSDKNARLIAEALGVAADKYLSARELDRLIEPGVHLRTIKAVAKAQSLMAQLGLLPNVIPAANGGILPATIWAGVIDPDIAKLVGKEDVAL